MAASDAPRSASPNDRQLLPATGKADERLQSFDRLMRDFLGKHGHAQTSSIGASLAVARNGKLLYARGFGFADYANREPIKPTSLFRIASISKPITAVAVMQLVEQGRLSLDDAAYERLPAALRLPEGPPNPLGAITVRHLLHHRGGWDRDSSFDAMFRPVQIARQLGTPPPAAPAEIIRYMHHLPLDFAPGARYAYSNFGYCLLGRIIEAQSGQPYESYVQQKVLAPLGIRSMQIGRTLAAHRAPGEVVYYDAVEGQGRSVFAESLGKMVPRPYGAWHLEAMDAHGGWIASAIDLVRFATALDGAAECQVLNARWIARMAERPNATDGYEEDGRPQAVHYGLGWSVRTLPDGRMNLWHTGSLPGTSTILVRRHDGLSWAVLFNTREADDGQALARKIDPLLHQAAGQVTEWPEEDLFEHYGYHQRGQKEPASNE